MAGAVAVDARSEKALEGVLPGLRWRVEAVLRAMATAGHPMVVTSGRRTTAEQQALYAQGRTAPGPVVTQIDGVRRVSRHQQGRAVDCAFRVGPRGVTWDGPWATYGQAARDMGLIWGGDWARFPDRPHVEWLGDPDATGPVEG